MGNLAPYYPLPTVAAPVCYIVCFSLNGPADAYDDFFETIRQSDEWLSYIPGVVIVRSRRTLVSLATELRQKIRTGDRLLVMPAKGPADGWMPKDAWEWMNARLPREW
jgi:hypothetical protein